MITLAPQPTQNGVFNQYFTFSATAVISPAPSGTPNVSFRHAIERGGLLPQNAVVQKVNPTGMAINFMPTVVDIGTWSFWVEAIYTNGVTIESAYQQYTFQIDKAAAVVTASDQTTEYTGSPVLFSNYTISPNLPVQIEYTLNPVTSSSVPTSVAPTLPGIYTVSVLVADNLGYYGGSGATLTITKATSTISFTQPSDKTYGAAPFTLTATSTSGYPVRLESQNTSILSIAGNLATIQNVGPGFVNVIAYEESPFHNALSVTRKIILLKSAQDITATVPSDITTRTLPFQINASASSGLPITYVPLQGQVTVSSGGVLSVLKEGPVVIRLDQLGSQNYHPTSLTISFSVSVYTQVFQEGVSAFLGTASPKDACPIPSAQDYLLCEPTPGVWPSLQNPISGLWDRVEIWWEYVKKTENW